MKNLWHRSRLLRVLTYALLTVLLAPLLIPLRSPAGTTDPRQLGGPASRWVDVGGIDVHYEEYGDGAGGPTLLLLHGFGASTFSWRDVAGPLAATGARVVVFDRVGFGLTERPMPGGWQGETPYGDAAAIRLTVGLMDALGVERAVLVGHSAGGTVAVLTALTYPERVSGLVLVAPALGQAHGLRGWVRALATSPQGRRVGPLLLRGLVGRLEGALDGAWYDPSRLTAEVREGYTRPLRALNWNRALWEIVLAPRTGGLAGRVGELGPQLPVLFVTGDTDTFVPATATQAAAAAMPGAQLVVMPRCGHLPHEEYPEEWLGIVVPFVGQVGGVAP